MGVLDTSKVAHHESTTSERIGNEHVHNNIVNNGQQNVNNDDESTKNTGNENWQNVTEQSNTSVYSNEKEYVKGTTWVFDDGSQVVLKPQNSNMIEDENDNESFYTEFEHTTGGENFDQTKKQDAVNYSTTENHHDDKKESPIIHQNEGNSTGNEGSGVSSNDVYK